MGRVTREIRKHVVQRGLCLADYTHQRFEQLVKDRAE
jgi:hypothetical protein